MIEPARVTWPAQAADKHQAAVSNSLNWADEAAKAGDFRDALGWLAAVEASGDALSARYLNKRRAWGQAMRAL